MFSVLDFQNKLQHKLYCEQSAITLLRSCRLHSNKYTLFCMTWRASVCTLVNWLSWILKHREQDSFTQEWVADTVKIKTGWILYGRGRVWVQQLSSAESHRRFSFLRWPTQFFIVCLCMQNKWTEKSHCRTRSGSGSELKLRWQTQTLHGLNKKHQTGRNLTTILIVLRYYQFYQSTLGRIRQQ